MQLITNRSKILLAILISCTFAALYPLTKDQTPVVGQAQVGNQIEDISFTPTSFSMNNVNPAEVQSFWSSLGSQLKLDHQIQTRQVQAEIHKLLADRDKLVSILRASSPYIYFIDKQAEARGLPAELALIPVIESEFNPNDHSNKGATGLWQLMPQTARDLGIKVKSQYDGRRNVLASTKGALAYFNDLGNLFNGNWYLAIAAYNCGEVKVESAIKHAGTHSFFSLKVPQETKLYVPRLLAVAAIVKDPQKYGIVLPPVSNEPYFAEVKVKKPVSLFQVSKSAGVDLAILRGLNPDYNRRVVYPSKSGDYIILVPANKVTAVEADLKSSIIT
jgi:membrane-bound lytic murein transglycosylase D